jgi:hypothetical protein
MGSWFSLNSEAIEVEKRYFVSCFTQVTLSELCSAEWYNDYVGFEVLTAVVMKSTMFCDITPCIPLRVNRRFGAKYHLNLQGQRISQAGNKSALQSLLATCFYPGFLLGLRFDPEDGGDIFLRNVAWHSRKWSWYIRDTICVSHYRHCPSWNSNSAPLNYESTSLPLGVSFLPEARDPYINSNNAHGTGHITRRSIELWLQQLPQIRIWSHCLPKLNKLNKTLLSYRLSPIL